MALPLFKEVLYGAAHLIFPRLCEACRAPLLIQERVLCLACEAVLPRTDFHDLANNETTIRISGRFPFEHATSFAYFTGEGVLQHLLHRLKYSGRQAIGEYLGEQAGLSLRTASWAADIDMVVPVPLHPRKQSRRGYNQSALIAAGIARVLDKPVREDVLVRVKHTASQAQTGSREERILNVQGAFDLAKSLVPGPQHILLVDDVLTTGATLEAAAAALQKAPGYRLSICTIALAKD